MISGNIQGTTEEGIW